VMGPICLARTRPSPPRSARTNCICRPRDRAANRSRGCWCLAPKEPPRVATGGATPLGASRNPWKRRYFLVCVFSLAAPTEPTRSVRPVGAKICFDTLSTGSAAVKAPPLHPWLRARVPSGLKTGAVRRAARSAYLPLGGRPSLRLTTERQVIKENTSSDVGARPFERP
jgi:hypothetical protein